MRDQEMTINKMGYSVGTLDCAVVALICRMYFGINRIFLPKLFSNRYCHLIVAFCQS